MICRSRVFNSSWVLSQNWIRATSRPFPCAFSYGDISCEWTRSVCSDRLTSCPSSTVTISIPEKTFSVIVLAQQDTRYFAAISGYSTWSLDFTLFRAGDTEPLATASHSRFWGRSVQLEAELEAGEYVVHVGLASTYPVERMAFSVSWL